jgi:hypothetical protein
MDDWKEEHIINVYEEKSNLYECIKERVKHVRGWRIQHSNLLVSSFGMKMKSAERAAGDFLGQEKEIVERSIRETDEALLALTFKYYKILEEKKRIEFAKDRFIETEISLIKQQKILVYDLIRFASMLSFESNGGIILKHIPAPPPTNTTTTGGAIAAAAAAAASGSGQFSRCKRAVTENAVNGFFDGQVFSNIMLTEAFKIENAIRLREFEDKLSRAGNEAVLKGLFIVVERD